MPIESRAASARLITFGSPLQLLTDGKLQTVLLQTARPSIEQIRDDQSRPASVQALRSLLDPDGDHLIKSLAPGNRPVLVVAPEHAFGSVDWETVDGLIRGVDQRLVLVGGFGNALAGPFKSWAAADHAIFGSPTQLFLGWDDTNHPLAADRPINGGWCWVHDQEVGTACITFAKTWFDQATELAEFPELQPASELTRVRFADLELFPLICADLLRSRADGEHTAQSIISNALGHADDRPVLITGSLMQLNPANWNWAAAIAEAVNQPTNQRKVVLGLVNQACSAPVANSQQDEWRNLSGVYVRRTALPKLQPSLPACRPLAAGTAAGAVVRANDPCVVSGAIAWPDYGPVAGLYLWLAGLIQPVGNEGIEARNGRNRTAAAEELYRFTLRFEANATWNGRVADGLSEIRNHIASDAPPTAERVLDTLLFGIRRDRTPKADAIDDYSSALAESLYGVATLLTDGRFGWQPHQNQVGQIRVPDTELNVLVWRDAEFSGGQIVRELQAWSRSAGEHPPLLVLARGARTSIDIEGPVGAGDRRTSIDEPPSRPGDLGVETGDFTVPRAHRKVFSARLERVASFYEDHPDEDGAFEQLLHDLLDLCHV